MNVFDKSQIILKKVAKKLDTYYPEKKKTPSMTSMMVVSSPHDGSTITLVRDCKPYMKISKTKCFKQSELSEFKKVYTYLVYLEKSSRSGMGGSEKVEKVGNREKKIILKI